MTATTSSFGVTRVEVPDQAEVDEFLGPPDINWHIALDPLRPMAVDPLTGGAGGIGPRNFVRYRKGQCRGMQNALRVIERGARRPGASGSAAITRRWSRNIGSTAPNTRWSPSAA